MGEGGAMARSPGASANSDRAPNRLATLAHARLQTSPTLPRSPPDIAMRPWLNRLDFRFENIERFLDQGIVFEFSHRVARPLWRRSWWRRRCDDILSHLETYRHFSPEN